MDQQVQPQASSRLANLSAHLKAPSSDMSESYNIPPQETAPRKFNHLNGSTDEILARFCVSELCLAWPVYRDASEWRNYRESFADDAVVFTTWAGGMQIDDFVDTSIRGRANGDFIMHRVNGVLVDLNLERGRAIGKMKATITQRFTLDGIQCDVDCDNRFIFFCQKYPDGWKIRWHKLFYEKDKLIPVDGKTVPHFPQEELDKYPEGYKYLGAAQAKLGHQVLTDLPNGNNEGFFKMYEAMEDWLMGKEVDLFWEGKPQ
ncbi:MAG: hypothetical protein M1831_001269 [Alyxoria varia]|nr:MAG: hypothetical protein M1831_001269 [Alyxoria varia]